MIDIVPTIPDEIDLRAPATRKLAEEQELDAFVGARIKRLRLDKGVSQAELARQLDISAQQLMKFEQGAHRINAGKLARIARILDVDPGEFFKGDIE